LQEHIFDEQFDAIIGLAYPAMAEKVGLPLVDNMIKQSLLEANLFAFSLSLNSAEPSDLTFGWIDDTKYTGDLTWHPVVNKYFWSLNLTDIKLNG